MLQGAAPAAGGENPVRSTAWPREGSSRGQRGGTAAAAGSWERLSCAGATLTRGGCSQACLLHRASAAVTHPTTTGAV